MNPPKKNESNRGRASANLTEDGPLTNLNRGREVWVGKKAEKK